MKMVALISILLTALAVQGLSLSLQQDNSDQPGKDVLLPAPKDDRFPAVRIPQPDGTQQLLKMDRLAVDIKVVGNLAITTMDMRFYNGLDRVLEGELSFPLGDGQTVSRFAMDVNEVLREGVVVEKAKARETFEKIVRQGIDPGLLELTKGNTFRSRVYPIPAQGYKRIVVAYEQELQTTGEGLLYTLPMQFPQAIDSFSFHAEVVNQSEQPDASQGEFKEAIFSKWQHSYRADYSATNFTANKQFALLVPGAEKNRVVVEQRNGETFFTLAITPPDRAAARMLPRSVCLLWDASGSGATRDKERELAVLNGFFSAVGSCTVELVAFSNAPEAPRKFSVSGGNWSTLRSALNDIQFDGGTQLGALDLRSYRCDEFILVSDGVSNFGESEPAMGTVPVLVLNSAQTAEHSFLRAVAQRTGGCYVNLADATDEEAVHTMTHQPYSFISAQFSDGGVAEIYPSISTPVRGKGLMIAGKLLTPKATLTLNFGFGSRIVATETVVIDRARHSASTGVTPRIWAQKKLAELDMNYKKNKDAITALGQEYSIVTRNTSLIVLDRLEDYITYRIAPPESEPELRTAYFEALRDEEQIKTEEAQEHLDYVAELFRERQEWWSKDFSAAHKPQKKGRFRNAPAEADTMRADMDYGTGSGLGSFAASASDSAVSHQWASSEPEVLSGGPSMEAGKAASEEGLYKSVSPAPVERSAEKSAPAGVSNARDLAPSSISIRGTRAADTQVRVDGVETSDQFSSTPAMAPITMQAYTSQYTVSTDEAENDLKGFYDDNVPSSIQLKEWDPQTPYMNALKKASDKELYSVYLSLKPVYGTAPSFFLDVANRFAERNKKELALRILSNIAELQLENHQLLRILGNRLLQLGYPKLATAVFADVLAIREEEPQSYRDLALAFAADKQYQRAVDTLYSMVKRSWDDRFPEVELIALTEMNHVIAEAGKSVNTSHIDKRLISPMPVDMRVVLSWDADNCDIDLWITEPTGEQCSYQNTRTQVGGAMSSDLTGGYGPEEYLLKKAPKGTYKVQANYFGDRQQRLAGPTTIQLTLFTNYGRKNETRKDITLRLEDIQQMVDIGEFEFAAATGVRAVNK